MTIPLAAEDVLGDALLTVLEIFFLVIWVWILITIMIDLFRDHELSGWLKAVWVFFLIFVPFITALIYLIARGKGMRERAISQQVEMQKASEQYIKNVAGTSPVDELHKLNDLKEKGAISQEEFDRLKAQIVT
ncbi:MAG TPA: SHOCT domain-containing protein [Solirubrobacteraceae bacterium]|jgi:ABC-type multidrug transport system fused ATPase/permease subunit|nr:SHOCT domain-containing protein [Solirubrobacteraceae bacterium]